MYEIVILSKYISHKKEIKVNNLTPNYVPKFIYPLVVFKFDSQKPKMLNKSQNLLKISSKMRFLLLVIISALDNSTSQNRMYKNFE